MKASIAALSSDKGLGVLVIKDAPQTTAPFTYSITENSFGEHFSESEGWTGETSRIEPKEYAFKDGSLYIVTSPRLLDELDPLSSYTITLNDGPQGILFVQEPKPSISLDDIGPLESATGRALQSPAGQKKEKEGNQAPENTCAVPGFSFEEHLGQACGASKTGAPEELPPLQGRIFIEKNVQTQSEEGKTAPTSSPRLEKIQLEKTQVQPTMPKSQPLGINISKQQPKTAAHAPEAPGGGIRLSKPSSNATSSLAQELSGAGIDLRKKPSGPSINLAKESSGGTNASANNSPDLGLETVLLGVPQGSNGLPAGLKLNAPEPKNGGGAIDEPYAPKTPRAPAASRLHEEYAAPLGAAEPANTFMPSNPPMQDVFNFPPSSGGMPEMGKPKAHVAYDKDKSDGSGIIVVENIRSDNALQSYMIERSSDQCFLTKDGMWVSMREAIPVAPGGYGWEKTALSIALSPLMLRELDPLESYRMFLGDRNPIPLPVAEELPVARMPKRATLEDSPAPPVPEAEDLEELVELPKKGVLAQEPAFAQEPTFKEPSPEPRQEKEEEPLKFPQQAEEAGSKPASKKGIILTALLLLALAAGGLAFWLASKDQPSPPQEQNSPATGDSADSAKSKDTEGAASRKGSSAEQKAPAPEAKDKGKSQHPATPAATQPFVRQAKDRLRGSSTPEENFGLAKPMRAQGNLSPDDIDGVFLLIEDAAEKGNAEAAFMLAQFYDPLSKLPRGSIQPDMEQAYLNYKKASDAGIPKAKEALEALKAEIKRIADAGNPDAARLLRTLR